MKDELTQVLINIITSATEAKNFVLRELPDVIHQLLLWNMTISLVYFATGVLLLLFSILVIINRCKSGNKRGQAYYADSEIIPIVCASVAGIPVGIVAIFVNLTWLQILVAPKVYLIEYAVSLAK